MKKTNLVFVSQVEGPALLIFIKPNCFSVHFIERKTPFERLRESNFGFLLFWIWLLLLFVFWSSPRLLRNFSRRIFQIRRFFFRLFVYFRLWLFFLLRFFVFGGFFVLGFRFCLFFFYDFLRLEKMLDFRRNLGKAAFRKRREATEIPT